jgi:hypothetical protein
MAPGILTAEATQAPHTLSSKSVKQDNNNAPKSIFPDGIRTSGQHEPIFDLLRPYEDFPKEISGPTVWTTEQYKSNPETWTHRFTAEEVAELGKTADDFMASPTELTGISQVHLTCSMHFLSQD